MTNLPPCKYLGLGRCHKSNVPGMAVLHSSHNVTEHVRYKREAIGKVRLLSTFLLKFEFIIKLEI